MTRVAILLYVLLLGGMGNAHAYLSVSVRIPHGQQQTVLSFSQQDEADPLLRHGFVPMYVDPCRGGVEVVRYDHARHPENESRRSFNEQLGGSVWHCYLNPKDKGLRWFLMAGGMTNSQSKPTMLAGPGLRFDFPDIKGFTLYAGGKAPFVYYEQRSNRPPVWGILPTVFFGFNYQIAPGLSIGAFQERLALGGIDLYGSTWQMPGIENHVTRPSRVPGNELTAFPSSAPLQDRNAGNMAVVLSYTF